MDLDQIIEHGPGVLCMGDGTSARHRRRVSRHPLKRVTRRKKRQEHTGETRRKNLRGGFDVRTEGERQSHIVPLSNEAVQNVGRNVISTTTRFRNLRYLRSLEAAITVESTFWTAS